MLDASALENSVLSLIRDCKSAIFAVGVSTVGETSLTFYLPQREGLRSRKIKRTFSAHLKANGHHLQVKLVTLKEDQLSKIFSLEEFAAYFPNDWIIYDPSGSVRRARAIYTAISKCRRLLGQRLTGAFLEVSGRKLHAVLNKKTIEEQGGNILEFASEAEGLIRQAISIESKRDNVCVAIDVHAGLRLQNHKVVAVDGLTLDSVNKGEATFIQRFSKRALPLAVAAALGLCASTAMADKPAVSGLNAKVEALGGVVEGDGSYAGAASVSFPLGNRVGAQIDGAYGAIDNDTLYGTGLHMFVRDPDSYLFGAYGSYSELDDANMYRAALEAEIYAGAVTFATQVGHQSGDVDSDFFGTLDLRYYPTDNLQLKFGGSLSSDDKQGHIGVEFMPALDALKGLSFFADASIGENDYNHVLGGFRYYFGSKKSLIKRHREDDPVNPIFLGATGSIHALRKAKSQAKAKSPIDEVVSGGGGGQGSF